MAFRKWVYCFVVIELLSLVAFCLVPLPWCESEARTTMQRHVLSWESLRLPERYRRWTGAWKSRRRFEVKRLKVVRMEKTSFRNRRPYQFSTPISSGQIIYVGVDAGKFYAVDTHVMAKRWTFETEGGIHAPAAVEGDDVFVGDVKGFVYALDRQNGKERWRVQLDDEVLAAPLVVDQRVFMTTQSGRLYALERQGGGELWHTDPIEKGYGFSVHRASTPTFSNGQIILGTATGRLMAFSADDGSVRWLKQLGDRQAQVFDVDSKPLVVQGRIYVSTADGQLFQIDPIDGRIVWSIDIGSPNDILIDQETLFVAGQGVLSAVDPLRGSISWQQDFETPEISSPVAGEHYVAVVSTSDKLYLLDRDNGDIAFARYVRKGSFGDPIVVENRIFLLANTSRLFGFSVREAKSVRSMVTTAGR